MKAKVVVEIKKISNTLQVSVIKNLKKVANINLQTWMRWKHKTALACHTSGTNCPKNLFLSVDSFLILSTILDFSTKKRRAIYSVKTAGSPYKTGFISDLYHDFDFYHLIFIYLACDLIDSLPTDKDTNDKRYFQSRNTRDKLIRYGYRRDDFPEPFFLCIRFSLFLHAIMQNKLVK